MPAHAIPSLSPPEAPAGAISPRQAADGVLWTLTLMTAALAALWLWTSFCRFPDEFWNDMRVAASVAMSRGIDVYPTLTEGVVNTWTYGPLPLVLMQPSALANTASGALVIAGALNGLYVLGPIVLTCLFWPGVERRFALLATSAVIVFWPESPWRCFYADSTAVSLGLLSSLVLVHARGRRSWQWAAALLAVAPLACKQTSLGAGVAQVIWLAITAGRRPALAHFGRCAAAGLALGLLGLMSFGWPGLSFVLLELPAKFSWTDDPGSKIRALLGPLMVQFLVPVAVMAARRDLFFRREAPLLLPALAWLCSLPAGAAALLKLGGGLNSLQGYQLWLPATVAVLVCASAGARAPRRTLALAMAALAVSLAVVRLHSAAFLAWSPRVASIQQGEELARSHPGRVWFPLNPLITLYSDGRYYYDEDGIYVRLATGQALTFGQTLPHLPMNWSAIAIRYRRDASWQIAETMIPKDARPAEYGVWKLNVWGPLAPPP